MKVTSRESSLKSDSTCLQEERLTIKWLPNLEPSPNFKAEIGQDVIEGLMQPQKSVPPRYFYDDYGSQLFEKICDLPEYYPTRTETSILRQFAGEIAQTTGACELVELGSGSSTKTRLLLDAYEALGASWQYVPIDVSGQILEQSARQLKKDYPSLQIQALVGTYEQALAQLQPTTFPARTISFLGSTLGNFSPQECDEFLLRIFDALAPGDYFLLGVDLQKQKPILEAAYNDSQGVTAAFNLNMLTHLNQHFSGNFNLELFEHCAFYNEELNQIEMHLQCLQSHSVCLDTLNLRVELDAGETIMTEISRKFDVKVLKSELKEKGLEPINVWTDPKQWFGSILCQAR